MRRSAFIVLSLVSLGALVGCSVEPGAVSASADGSRVLVVTATTGMIADAARNVAGDHARVEALMGPGVDPHLYKATQGDLGKLSNADIIFYNGLHLEGKMADVLEKLASRTKTVAVSDAVPRDLLRQPPEFAGQYDPHIWFDVRLWMRAVEQTRDAFIEVDPDRRGDYEANAKAYLAKLDELDNFARSRVKEIPEEQRVLVTAHDAFGYFGQAYGIDVMGLQGISTAAEFGLKDLDRVINVIVDRKVKAVFVESSVPRKSIEALIRGVEGKGHTIAIGGTLYSDAMGAQGTPEGTYEGMVRHNVNTIVEALN